MVLEPEPHQIVDQRYKDTEHKHSERVFLYALSVVEHVYPCSANGQVHEISSEKEHEARQYRLNTEDDLCKSKPGDMGETKLSCEIGGNVVKIFNPLLLLSMELDVVLLDDHLQL